MTSATDEIHSFAVEMPVMEGKPAKFDGVVFGIVSYGEVVMAMQKNGQCLFVCLSTQQMEDIISQITAMSAAARASWGSMQ